MGSIDSISNLIQAKSVQRVLAPIAAQVSQLLILNESDDGHKTMGNMIPFAQSVLRASEELVQISKKSAAEFDDQDLEEEMWEACNEMTSAGRSILMAIQLLQAENGSKTSKAKLAHAGKNLLLATLKVLQVSDESDVRKIELAVQNVQSRLALILSVKSMKNLVSSFKAFTESTLFLVGLCEKRRKDLTDPSRQQQLASALASVNRLIPVLNSVLQNYIKYPTNIHAKASCDLIYKHVTEALTCITHAVQTSGRSSKRQERRSSSETTEDIHFSTEVAKIVQLLSPKHRLDIKDKLGELVSGLVKHCMCVCALSTDETRESLSSLCKQILHKKVSILEREEVIHRNPDFSQLAKDQRTHCEDLARDVLGLEDTLRRAVLSLVVDTGYISTEPMARMVKAATVSVKGKLKLDDGNCKKVLEPLDDVVHDHMDKLCQVALFVSSICSDNNKCDRLQGAVKAIEHLDPEIFPSCFAVRKDSKDKAAMSHLKLVYREWCQEVNNMMEAIDDVIEVETFMELSESSIESDVTDIQHAARDGDDSFVAKKASNLLGKAKRILKIAKEVQNKWEDPICRNGLQVFIGQLENALPLVKNGSQYVIQDVNDHHARNQLFDRCEHLMECVRNVRLGMDVSNHPHLFSPLRDNARAGSSQRSTDFIDAGVSGEYASSKRNFSTKQDGPVNFSKDNTVLSSTITLNQSELPDISRLMLSTPNLTGCSKFAGVSQLSTPPNLTGLNLNCSEKSVHVSGFPPRLKLVYPVRSAVRVLFMGNQGDIIWYLEELKRTSQRLVAVAERAELHVVDKDKRFKSVCDSLGTSTSSVVTALLEGKGGNDASKAEVLIAAEDWSREYCHLEDLLKEALQPWLQVVQSVTEASKSTKTSITKQVDNLETFRQSILKLVSILENKHLVQRKSETQIEKQLEFVRLEKVSSDWADLTIRIQQQATQLSLGPGNEQVEADLQFLSLEWAVDVCDVVRRIVFHLKNKYLPHAYLLLELNKRHTSQDLQMDLEAIVAWTKRFMQLIDVVTAGDSTNQEIAHLHHLKDQLKTLSYSLSDRTHVLLPSSSTVDSASLKQDRSFYSEADCKILILEALCVTRNTCECLDQLTGDGGLLVDKLIGVALSCNSSEGSSRQHFLNEYHTLADMLSLTVSNSRQYCVTLLMNVPANEKKVCILKCIEEIARITPKILSITGDLADKQSVSKIDLYQLKREWCCSVYAICSCLKNLPGLTTKVAIDIRLLFQGVPGSNQSLHSASRGAFEPFDNVTVSPLLFDHPIGQPNLTSTPGAHGYSSPLSHTAQRNGIGTSPSIRVTPASHRHSSPPTGKGHELYADTSYLYQGEEPRLVTSPSKIHVQEEEQPSSAKPFRSRPLGIDDLSRSDLKSASATSFRSESPRNVYLGAGSIKCSSSIAAAALILQQEADKWEEDNNQIIQVAREMSEQMYAMAGFAKRKESKMGKLALVETAKDIAANGSAIYKFAEIIAKYCQDEKFAKDLLFHANQIPSLATQLNIIASVKAATPEDYSSDVVIVKNAENLMNAVTQTLKAAEAACVKGLRCLNEQDDDEQAAAALASQWKRKLHRHRMIEAATREVDALGLRRISKHVSAPSLVEIVGK